MGIEERRKNEKEQMKKLIMDAAIHIINKEGYDNLSLRKIARRIDYSPTTVYLYYKDKAQIIEEITYRLYLKTERNCITAGKKYDHLPVDERLRKILLTFIHSLVSEPEIAKSIMLGSANNIFANSGGGDIPENPGLSSLEQLMQSGVEQGVFASDITGSSWMIVSSLLGFILCAIENQLYIRDDFQQLSTRFVNLLIGGIYENTDTLRK